MTHSDGTKEVWKVVDDYTFTQNFYRFGKDKPFFSYEGKWSFNRKSRWTELEFEKSATLINYGAWSLMDYPEIYANLKASYIYDEHEKPQLGFYLEGGYVAKKSMK